MGGYHKADCLGPVPQALGDPRPQHMDSFWGRGFRQVREPVAEALWEGARSGGGGSSAARSARPRGSLTVPRGVDPRTIPPPQPVSRLDRVTESMLQRDGDVEDLDD